MTCSTALCVILAAMACVAASGVAQERPPQQELLWADAFGEGMRAWAESDYDKALTHLYRAYAFKPTSYNLGLIVRSHDFLTECSAAKTQLAEYASLYPGQDVPALQQCTRLGELVVSCVDVSVSVHVQGRALGVCDKPMMLPAGDYEVSVPELGYAEVVSVEQDKVLALKPGASRPRVDKLVSTAERYTIFMAPDGLYQIWVLSSEPELMETHVEGNSCTREGKEGKALCKPLTKTQRDELEKVAPKILLLSD